MAFKEHILRKQLQALLIGGESHMDFDEAIADLALDRVNAKTTANPYSIWHIIEHMRIAQRDILDFIRIHGHVSPDFPDGYRPRADLEVNRALWEKTVDRFRTDLNTLSDMAINPGIDLFGPIVHAPEYTILRELVLVADHNAYHIGEIAMLRQELHAWPKGREYLTGEGTAVPE